MRINRAILLFITILGQNLYAQSVLRFQHINVEDGLSQSTVNYFFQDAHGFIWLATGDGLNRYDGKQFIVYKSHFSGIARTPVSDRNINSKIFEDKYNRLWFSSDAGVSYMDTRTGRFAVVLDKYSTVCSGLLSSIDSGSLWVATAHKGFLCVNIENSKIDIYPFTDKWQINNDVNPLTSSAATKRAIWVTDKYGLICFDKHTKRDQRKLLKGGLNSVNVLKNGNLLLGYKDGVFLYNTGNDRIEFITIKEISEKKEIEWRTFAEDTLSGTVYLGSSVGGTICKLDLRNRKYQLLNFQNNTICDLFIDRSENLWIGTDGNGACKLDISPPKFFCFGPRPVYAETEQTSFFVTSIYRAGNGKIWMGVVNDGLVVYDPSTSRQQKIPLSLTDAEQVIRSIFADSAGHLVVAVSNSVLWLDPVSYKIIGTTTLPRQPQINSVKPIVYALTEWKKGHYFAGTNLGVYAVTFEKNHPKSWMPGAFQKDTFLTVWPYNFYKAGNGSTYIGMRRGFINITILSDSQIHINDVGFRDIPVRHFYKSAQYSILWIASEQGLIAYNEQTKQYRIFDEKDGMPNSFVYAILDQNDSMLWISTNKGITNAKVHYTSNGNVTAEFVNYGVRDGLQSDEFNTGAYFKDKDGMLYFGGIAGINWFDPRNVKPSPLKASPAISGIYVNDSLYAGDTAVYVRKIILPYTRNTISLSYSALQFGKPGDNIFAYKLDGLDKDWVHTANDNIRYSNLSPGAYKFYLKAGNKDGIWNAEPLTLTIFIQPPYWQTWWFRTLIIALIAALGAAATRFYIRQKVRATTKKLEQQQALYLERLRISKDVHDDLGSGLSKISLMAAIAEHKAGVNEPLANYMKHISSISKELVDNMRDLVWVLNPENTTLEQLVSRLREYCADYLENIPVRIKLDFPDQVPAMRISREAQRNIFLTVKEAINNCIKHADASEIGISLTLAHGLHIVIADNGRGFNPADLKGSGNGLRNMRQRVESIGGTFTITSSVSESTSIDIRVSLESLCAEKNTTLV